AEAPARGALVVARSARPAARPRGRPSLASRPVARSRLPSRLTGGAPRGRPGASAGGPLAVALVALASGALAVALAPRPTARSRSPWWPWPAARSRSPWRPAGGVPAVALIRHRIVRGEMGARLLPPFLRQTPRDPAAPRGSRRVSTRLQVRERAAERR